jgi:serine/threonine protein kinase
LLGKRRRSSHNEAMPREMISGSPAFGGSEPGLDAAPPQNPSFRFGKYQLFATLGHGGMADVFLAVAHGPMGFNKLTVIKRLKPVLSTEPSFRQMFLDEARLAARLAHPHVVHTYEVGEEDGAYFLAMEYIQGQSLNRVIKQTLRRGQRIDPLVAGRIVADALDGLAYAHELLDYDGRPLSVIHRDVSPHNLLLGYDGNVKVVDFGIAKATSSSTETEIGVLKGKVAYMAPEQATGMPIDARADLFPMGIVLWEMLTHKRLMAADSAAITLHKLMNERIPRVSEHVPGIDPRIDDIVARALEKDPRDRWPSARAFRDALDEVLSTSPRLVRHEEVSRWMSEMFTETREDTHRQIQTYMASMTARGSSPPPALSTLTQESLRRLQQGSSSQQLLLLGVSSGSGSGVVPRASTAPSIAPVPATATRRPAFLPILLASLLGIALLVILVLLLRPRPLPDGPVASNPMMAPVGSVPAVTALPAVAPPVAPPVTVAPPATAAAPPTPTPAASLAPVAPAIPPTPAAPPTHARPPVDRDPSSSNVGGGFLTFDTYPWTKVSEGGRVLGTTPLVHVALSAGAHVLTLDNPDQGIHQTYEVTVKSGDTVSRRLGLK